MSVLFTPRRIAFGVNVGNHGQTTRASYTVPNGQIAEIEHIYIRLVENVATAFNGGSIIAYIGAATIIRVQTFNAIAMRDMISQSRIYMDSGETLNIDTVNSSVNVLTFTGFALIKEYN